MVWCECFHRPAWVTTATASPFWADGLHSYTTTITPTVHLRSLAQLPSRHTAASHASLSSPLSRKVFHFLVSLRIRTGACGSRPVASCSLNIHISARGTCSTLKICLRRAGSESWVFGVVSRALQSRKTDFEQTEMPFQIMPVLPQDLSIRRQLLYTLLPRKVTRLPLSLSPGGPMRHPPCSTADLGRNAHKPACNRRKSGALNHLIVVELDVDDAVLRHRLDHHAFEVDR